MRGAAHRFLAAGGDGFGTLKSGTDVRTFGMDIDALEAYVASGAAAQLTTDTRIQRVR